MSQVNKREILRMAVIDRLQLKEKHLEELVQIFWIYHSTGISSRHIYLSFTIIMIILIGPVLKINISEMKKILQCFWTLRLRINILIPHQRILNSISEYNRRKSSLVYDTRDTCFDDINCWQIFAFLQFILLELFIHRSRWLYFLTFLPRIWSMSSF